MKTKTFITTVLIALIAINTNAFSKKIKGNGNVITENRTTESYDEISVGGSFEVELISGKEGNITIEIEENLAEYLITEVKKGELKVHWKKGINVSTNKTIRITIPFEEIEGVSLAGSGRLFSKATISAENLSLSMAGSGDMELTIDTQDLKTSLAGSGSMNLEGSADSMESSLAGSGDLAGFGLVVGNTAISLAGSGTVKATINGTLNVAIAGSGDIYYKGNPKTETIKVSGSGSVTKK